MRKILLLFGCLIFFAGCQISGESTNNDKLYVTTQQNDRLKIEFYDIERAVINGEEGFFVEFHVHHLSGPALNEQNYAFSLQEILQSGEHKYETKAKSVQFTEDKAIVSQFYTPLLIQNNTPLPVSLNIKPLYYKKEIVFEDLNNNSQNVEKNDLTILDIQVEKNQLQLMIHDVHPLAGLKMTLLINNEEIYPTFLKSDLNKKTNVLSLSTTFSSPLPEPFTLKFTRHHLGDISWNVPFYVPKKKITADQIISKKD